MSHLRREFENETGKVADNCTGIGDYSGLCADDDINADYIKWLESKVEKLKPPNKQSVQSLCDNCQRFGCKLKSFDEHYIFISKCSRWARRD